MRVLMVKIMRPTEPELLKPGLKKWVSGYVKHLIFHLQLMVAYIKPPKVILRINLEQI